MPMKWAEAFAEFSSQMKHLAPAALVPAWSRVKPSAAHDHVYYLNASVDTFSMEKQFLKDAQHHGKELLARRLKKELAKRTAAKMPIVSSKDPKYYKWFAGQVDTELGRAIIRKQHLLIGADGIWQVADRHLVKGDDGILRAVHRGKRRSLPPTAAPTPLDKKQASLLEKLMADFSPPTVSPTPAVRPGVLLAQMKTLMDKMAAVAADNLLHEILTAKEEQTVESLALLPPSRFPTPRPTHMAGGGDKQHHHHHNKDDDDDDDDDDSISRKKRPVHSDDDDDAIKPTHAPTVRPKAMVVDAATMKEMLAEARAEGIGAPP
jgi:hypothetical protein